MPMIYQVGKSDVYSLITESQLIGSGFYGSFLEAKEDGSTTFILQQQLLKMIVNLIIHFHLLGELELQAL